MRCPRRGRRFAHHRSSMSSIPTIRSAFRYTRDEIDAISRRSPDSAAGALFVHDCTYRDFAAGHHPALTGQRPSHAVVTAKLLQMARARRACVSARSSRRPGALRRARRAFRTSVLGASVLAQRAATGRPRPQGRVDGAKCGAIDADANKAMIRDGRSCASPGMHAAGLTRRHGNFLTIETDRMRASDRRRSSNVFGTPTRHHDPAGNLSYRAIRPSLRQDQHVRTPNEWAENGYATLLPALVVTRPASLNDVPPQF